MIYGNDTKKHRGRDGSHRYHRLQRRERHHVHFDSGEDESVEQHQEMQVSCDVNPTKLFLLMNSQHWDEALLQLQQKPIEAHVWIYSSYFTSNDEIGGGGEEEYKWCNLPLHLACMCGNVHNGTSYHPPLQFMESLIDTYPGACSCCNHEGNLPIHLACECMDMGSSVEVEGILAMLIRAFPECLDVRDGTGRKPIDILEAKGVSGGVGIIRFMKIRQRRVVIGADPHDGGEVENEGANKYGDGNMRKRRSIDVPHKITTDCVFDSPRSQPTLQHSGSTSSMESRGGVCETTSRPQSILRQTNRAPPLESRDESERFSRDDAAAVVKDGNMNKNSALLSGEGNVLPSETPEPSNNMPIVSPQSSNSTGHSKDLFDQLESEWSIMRTTHQSLSNMLSAKAESANDLQDRLHKLEMQHERLLAAHAKLENVHAGTISELEEKTKALENGNYEMKIIKSKERAVSSELALTMEVRDKQDAELKKLKNELEKKDIASAAAAEKLEFQSKVHAKLEEKLNATSSKNADFVKENDNLLAKNKEAASLIAEKDKQLKHAKLKETVLLDILSNEHSKEDFEGKINKINKSTVKPAVDLAKDNEELQDQVLNMGQLYSKWKNRATELKVENEELALKSRELERLLKKTEELQGTASDVDVTELDKLRAQNRTLRDAALKAIGTARSMHHSSPSSNICGDEELLSKMCNDIESVSHVGASSSQREHIVAAGESLEQLRPIIADAQNLQRDVIDQIQRLLQQSHATLKHLDEVDSIPAHSFIFDHTLQILEDTIKSRVHCLETLSDMIQTTDVTASNLASLFVWKHAGGIEHGTGPENNGDANDSRALDVLTKHIEQLQGLSTVVSSLPTMGNISLHSDDECLQTPLSKVGEIISILQEALTNLVQDAKLLKVILIHGTP